MGAVRSVNKIMGPLARRVRLMIGRGVLALVNDSLRMQALQVRALSGEVLENVEHWQPYGFTYHPLPGGEPLLVFPKGDRSHAVCIAVADRRYRVKGLAQGEVCLFDDLGQKITLYRDRIEVEAPKVVVKSDNVHLGAQGGPKVARIGDRVQVGTGSSAGLWPIVEGSAKVRSA